MLRFSLSCSRRGDRAVYGPQKGAVDAMILQMDRWLNDYAERNTVATVVQVFRLIKTLRQDG